MAADRPHLPAPLERRVLVEAGHRCAIPTCRLTPVEIAHIVPWRQVREHRLENLIALCPNCHTLFDSGRIDRLAMMEYKRRLSSADKTVLAVRVHAYSELLERTTQWERAARILEVQDIAEGFYFFGTPERDELSQACLAAQRDTETSLARFQLIHAEDTVRIARELHEAVRAWVQDILDGACPSIDPHGNSHEWYINAYEEDLDVTVSADLGIPSSTLRKLTGHDWIPSDAGSGVATPQSAHGSA